MTRVRPKRGSTPPAQPPAPSSPRSPWEQAGAPAGAGSRVPWQVEQDRTSPRWVIAVKVGAVCVLVIWALVGVRSVLTADRQSTPAVELPVSVTFDTAAAQGVAVRVVRLALAWDEDRASERASALSMDYTGQDRSVGWSGKGRQDIADVTAGHVEVTSSERAVVEVTARVRAYERKSSDSSWEPVGDWSWVSVQVPVADSGGRMVVTGAPALVGRAGAQAPTSSGAGRSQDVALTEDTKSGATAFFEAFGAGDVSAVEAPGAQIVAPASSWTVQDLTWEVFEGSGTTRDARAQVTWAISGNQTLTQVYAVTCSLVSAGGADRWQVSAVAVWNG